MNLTLFDAAQQVREHLAEIGRRIARENAVSKVWSLMGYALKNKLAGV